jgi:hypothetical protein
MMKYPHRQLQFAAVVSLVATVTMAAAPPAPEAIPRLPVTTGWLGNSLLRGGQADWSDKSQTYLQLYTDDMVVADDGTVFCTTNWEEGHRPAGIYKDGDALPDVPMFHTTSGSAVAVSRGRLAYGQKGHVAVFTRGKDGRFEAASGRHIVFDAGKDAPQVTGLALDESGDAVVIGDESGVIRTYRFSDGKAIDAQGFPAPRPGQMRRDADGNLWVLVRPRAAGVEIITAKVFGSSPHRGASGRDAAREILAHRSPCRR